MNPWVAATALAVVAFVLAEWRGSSAGRWIAKPLAAAGFVAVALSVGAMRSDWGRLVVAGLVLGAIGDVLLLPRSPVAFTAGLGSFLLGHLAYAAAFIERGVSPGWLLASASLFVAPALASWAWLRDHLPGPMRTPVRAYVAVISAMVACAFGTWGYAGNADLLAGALLFAASDLSVARDRFVAPGLANRLWGAPAYFAGQVLIALGAATGGA